MSGSDLRVVVFVNASPMPGYIRGSAKQRGRAALTATPYAVIRCKERCVSEFGLGKPKRTNGSKVWNSDDGH